MRYTRKILKITGLCWAAHLHDLTCDQEVCEDQQAATAEADRTVGRRQGGQEEKAAGQFTGAQQQSSVQHTIHGCNKTTHTHTGQRFKKTGFSFSPQGERAQECQTLCYQCSHPPNNTTNFWTFSFEVSSIISWTERAKFEWMFVCGGSIILCR